MSGTEALLRVGILSNPRSHRNKAGLAAIEALARGRPNVLHRTVTGPDDIAATLDALAGEEIGLVALNGGDGTVQAALTVLFGPRSPFPTPPLLAVLRGGMTNLIAVDVGLRGGRERGLARLLDRAAEGRLEDVVTSRHLLRLEREPGADPLFGMFFGTAAICRAIEVCRRDVEPRGVEASAAAGTMLARIVGSALLGRWGGDPILTGDRIGITFDGANAAESRDWFLVLLTTLDRLSLNSRPYWGREPGGIRFTGIHFPPRRFVRAVLPVLYGGGGSLGPDYVSRNANSVSLNMTCPYTLDGEMFQPAPNRPVILSDGGVARFVRA